MCSILLFTSTVPISNAKATSQRNNSPDKPKIEYSYKNGQLQSVTDVYNNITSYIYKYGVLTEVDYQAYDRDLPIKLAQYNYDSLNRLASISYYNNQGKEYRYKERKYLDNETGQLGSLSEYTVSEDDVKKLESKVEYTYKIDSNINTQTIEDNVTGASVTDTYIYNSLNQLTKDDQQELLADNAKVTKLTNYTYDMDGNIENVSINDNSGTASKKYANDGLDQIVKIISSDIKGNQETHNFKYDNNGNLIQDGKGDTLTYNPLNQPISFKAPTGQETNYNYYPNNLLASQSEKNTPNVQNFNIYYNDAKYAQTLSEYYQGNNINFSHEISYIYGGNERLAREVDNNPVLQSYISNAKGDVLKVSNNTKDNKGVDYQYSAYGKPTKEPYALDQTVTNPFMYSGERYDSNTGLQYLRARFYSPELMRFINQDTTDLLNRFAYASGNPIMNTDPSGHFDFSSLIPFYGTIKAWIRHNWVGLGVGIASDLTFIATFGTASVGVSAGRAAGKEMAQGIVDGFALAGEETITEQTLYGEEIAAKKFQAAWKGYLTRNYEIPARRVSKEVEEQIVESNTGYLTRRKYMNIGRKNTYKNGGFLKSNRNIVSFRKETEELGLDSDEYYAALKMTKSGNCGEQAALAKFKLNEIGVIAEYGSLESYNHAITVVYSYKGFPLFVVDPWSSNVVPYRNAMRFSQSKINIISS